MPLPIGTGRGPADLRFSTARAQANFRGTPAQQGSLGVTDSRLLAPGQPARSILSLRMHALDANRMPPLASRVVDTVGVGVVDAWISSLTACP